MSYKPLTIILKHEMTCHEMTSWPLVVKINLLSNDLKIIVRSFNTNLIMVLSKCLTNLLRSY